jgi:two-component system phosphate regulon sensor histidine kinase PhoR
VAAVHLRWRRRFERAQEASRLELEKLNQSQQRTAIQVQARQEALLNSMVEGLLLLDPDGRIQLANRAFGELFVLRADVRGKTVMEALRRPELSELLDSLAGTGRPAGCELRLSHPVERWLEVNGAAITSAMGQNQGTLLVFHDLTRLKQLEAVRTEFVANVSHELRTPLSLIKGYVETLLDGARDNPEVAARFLQTIARNAERLQLLIEDLLTISALESGSVKLNLQPVLLPPLVERVLADFKSRAEARGVTITGQAPAATVRADADRLEQVFGNLIDNAIKYGRAGGLIKVGGTLRDSGQIELYVEDDGPGIPPAAIERVFERFYRVDKARSREQGGTGLGLSIVKHIIQSHGGKVWAKSEPRRGAAFYFTLPLDAGQTQPELL